MPVGHTETGTHSTPRLHGSRIVEQSNRRAAFAADSDSENKEFGRGLKRINLKPTVTALDVNLSRYQSGRVRLYQVGPRLLRSTDVSVTSLKITSAGGVGADSGWAPSAALASFRLLARTPGRGCRPQYCARSITSSSTHRDIINGPNLFA